MYYPLSICLIIIKKEVDDVIKDFKGENFDSVKDIMNHLDGEIDQVTNMHKNVKQNVVQATVKSQKMTVNV